MATKSHAVLVTGANRGLGLEFARQYAAEGWRVYAACRSPKGAKDLQHLAGESGGQIGVLKLDVTDAASVRGAAVELKGIAIDLLINNAGVWGSRSDRFGKLDYDAWAEVLDTNTLGPMRVIEAFVENVAKSRLKLIVTLTSDMGSIEDNASGGSYAYRSSKAAVNMVVKSLAIDLAPRGINCVAMNPGWARTDMGGPQGRLSPTESIKALRSVIASLKPEDSGRYLNYTGKPLPW